MRDIKFYRRAFGRCRRPCVETETEKSRSGYSQFFNQHVGRVYVEWNHRIKRKWHKFTVKAHRSRVAFLLSPGVPSWWWMPCQRGLRQTWRGGGGDSYLLGAGSAVSPLGGCDVTRWNPEEEPRDGLRTSARGGFAVRSPGVRVTYDPANWTTSYLLTKGLYTTWATLWESWVSKTQHKVGLPPAVGTKSLKFSVAALYR